MIQAYLYYDQNKKLIDGFMKLSHEMYMVAYHTDILHTAVGLSNLAEGQVMYISFDLDGNGVYSLVQDGVPEQKICYDLHRSSRGNIYRFVAGEETYTLIEQYTYRSVTP
jgi:hypothetical protein